MTFADFTTVAGISFSYFSGDGPKTPGMRLMETNRSGGAVLDTDGLPEIYHGTAKFLLRNQTPMRNTVRLVKSVHRFRVQIPLPET